MYDKFNEILHEIDDCKDMDNFDEHCQIMLKSVFGLDFTMFFDILNCIAKNRLKILNVEGESVVLNEVEFGRNHALFDLHAMKSVIEEIDRKCSIKEFKKASQTLMSLINKTLT